MKLEDQVCSLELSKKLKKLGFEQDSLWYWVNDLCHLTGEDNWKIFDKDSAFNVNKHKPISTYTVAELGNMLLKPEVMMSSRSEEGFGVSFSKDTDCDIIFFKADTESNSRAKMLIYLKENDLV